MESLALELHVTSVRLHRDRHPADRVLRRPGTRRDVGRRVMMIVFHIRWPFVVSRLNLPLPTVGDSSPICG